MRKGCNVAAIIAAIIAVIAPIVLPALLEWLKSIFNKAEKNLKNRQFGSQAEAANALIEEAIRLTPKVQVFKRLFLRILRPHAASMAQGFPLTAHAADDLADAGKQAAK